MAEGQYQIFVLESALTADFEVGPNEPNQDVKTLGKLYGDIFPPDNNPDPAKYEPLVRKLLALYNFSPGFADSIEYNQLTAALPALYNYREVSPAQTYTGQGCVDAIRDLVAAAKAKE